MPLFLAGIAIIGSILLANYLVITKNDSYNRLFDWLLLFLNLPLILLGLLILIVPQQTLLQLQPNIILLSNSTAYGAGLFAMGFWGLGSGLKGLRQWLARWLPIDPNSPVHTLALYFSGILAGSTLLTLSQGGLEGFAETAVSTPLADFVLQQLIFVLLAVLGAGFLIRRRLPALASRLGLERPSWPQIKFGIRWIIYLVLIQWVVGAVWALADPAQSELLGGINEILLGDFDTLAEWIVVALGAGLGEEILFRGAIQPIFGLWFTSILFAVAHIQYGLTPITVLVFVISLALGVIRRKSNTTIAVFVHAGYDLVLGIFYLIATYLEQFIS